MRTRTLQVDADLFVDGLREGRVRTLGDLVDRHEIDRLGRVARLDHFARRGGDRDFFFQGRNRQRQIDGDDGVGGTSTAADRSSNDGERASSR